MNSVADDNEDQGLLSLTTEIVASFVGNNAVAIGDLPAVIAAVFGTLRSVTQGEAEKPAEAPVPAVPIKKSIGTDFLICLEDGQQGEDAQAASGQPLQSDAGPVPAALGASQDLPHGGTGLRGAALGVGQADRPRPKAGCRGTLPCPRGGTSSSRATTSGSWAQEEDQLSTNSTKHDHRSYPAMVNAPAG